MVIQFSCGHTADLDPIHLGPHPLCPTCGVGQVTRVITRAPTFSGSVRGPLVKEAS